MSRGVALAMAALVVTQLGLGWYLGVAPQASLAFWLLSGLTGLSAWRLTLALFPWTGRADATIRATMTAFAAIVLAGLTLGSLGVLGLASYLMTFAVVCGATFALTRPRATAISPPCLQIPIATIVIPLLAFIVAVGLVQSPLTLYDSVSYHLVFPARWLQDHRLSIVPTPFSDPAQAYQPANGELSFLWLMLPFHGDFAARIGQLPFLLLGAVALYAIARRCGARPDHAAYAPLFFLLARPVVEQAVGADVDVICAAAFVTSLYLGLVAIESDARRDWTLWGVSVGLFLGTKYLALVYVAVLLALPLVRGPRVRALWAIPGLLVFAAPWYARNWIVAGSPIYPASLNVLGIVLARGAFARTAMNNSVFHVTDLRLLPAIVAHAFGAPSVLVWLPCAAVGVAALAARRRWWPGAYVAAVPLAMVSLFWFGLPDNGDSRFLLPAVAVAMVPLTFAFGANRRWNACVHAAFLIGAAWILVGTARQIPLALPWFMGDWLALDGLVSPAALPLFAGGVVIAAIICVLARRSPRARAPLIAVCCAGCAALTVGAHGAYARDRSSLLALSPTYIRAGMIEGWDWVQHHVEYATIANTGNNLPYPLFGEHLSNQVSYVNIDRHAEWRLHDYARVRSRAGATTSRDLARPSGQLMPLAEFRQASEASRPRYERWEGNADAWIRNLRAAKVTHLFVSVLSAYEIDYVWHNSEGFPVEDEWARADPHTFTLLFENGQVRVYALTR
jgi:hypothetical protein